MNAGIHLPVKGIRQIPAAWRGWIGGPIPQAKACLKPTARQGIAQQCPERGIPDEVRRKVAKQALTETELSPRELAMTFTDRESYFVSEASVYRVLKAPDLIASPASIVIKASNEFKD